MNPDLGDQGSWDLMSQSDKRCGSQRLMENALEKTMNYLLNHVKESVIIKNIIILFLVGTRIKIYRRKLIKIHFWKRVCYQQLDSQWEKMVQIREKSGKWGRGKLVRIHWETVGTRHIFSQLLDWSSSWFPLCRSEQGSAIIWYRCPSSKWILGFDSSSLEFRKLLWLDAHAFSCFALLPGRGKIKHEKWTQMLWKAEGLVMEFVFPPDVWSCVCWRKCEEQMFAWSSICLWRT